MSLNAWRLPSLERVPVSPVSGLPRYCEAATTSRARPSPGIEGITATDYEASLEANLGDLLARIKSGRYIGRRCDGATSRRPMDRTATRPPDIGRKDGRADDSPAAGAGLRDRLLIVLVRLPTETIGPLMPHVHCVVDSWSKGCAGWWTSTSRIVANTKVLIRTGSVSVVRKALQSSLLAVQSPALLDRIKYRNEKRY